MRRSTVRSIGWALVFGGLAAASPFRPSGWKAGLVAGLLVGVGVLLYRLWIRPRADEPGDDDGFGGLVREVVVEIRRIPVSVALALAVFVFLFEPLLLWFISQWRGGVWQNGHGLFVPLAMVYFAYRNLRGEKDRPAETSAWGFLFLVPALLLVAIDASLHTRYIAAFGFVLTLPGLSLLLLGIRRTRKLLLPLCLALFMLPVPSALSDQILMREWTAVGSAFALRTVGFSVLQNYTVLVFPHFSLDVTHACSGFAALYAGTFTGVTLAAFAQPRWRKLLLLAAIYPTALVANIFRVVLLTIMVKQYGLEILSTDFHPASGVASFVVVFAILGLVAGRQTLRVMFR